MPAFYDIYIVCARVPQLSREKKESHKHHQVSLNIVNISHRGRTRRCLLVVVFRFEHQPPSNAWSLPMAALIHPTLKVSEGVAGMYSGVQNIRRRKKRQPTLLCTLYNYLIGLKVKNRGDEGHHGSPWDLKHDALGAQRSCGPPSGVSGPVMNLASVAPSSTTKKICFSSPAGHDEAPERQGMHGW